MLSLTYNLNKKCVTVPNLLKYDVELREWTNDKGACQILPAAASDVIVYVSKDRRPKRRPS
jgi:hypothetical protein